MPPNLKKKAHKVAKWLKMCSNNTIRTDQTKRTDSVPLREKLAYFALSSNFDKLIRRHVFSLNFNCKLYVLSQIYFAIEFF